MVPSPSPISASPERVMMYCLPGSDVPVAEEPGRHSPKHNSLGVVQLGPVRMGRRVYHLNVGFAVVAGIQPYGCHNPSLSHGITEGILTHMSGQGSVRSKARKCEEGAGGSRPEPPVNRREKEKKRKENCEDTPGTLSRRPAHYPGGRSRPSRIDGVMEGFFAAIALHPPSCLGRIPGAITPPGESTHELCK